MKPSQTELQDIQAKLQLINAAADHPPSSQYSGEFQHGITMASAMTGTATPVNRNVQPEELAATVAALQQRSASQFKRYQATHLKEFPDEVRSLSAKTSEQHMAQELERLELQARQINQLAATQEKALLTFKALAKQIEQDWQMDPTTADREMRAISERVSIHASEPATVPYIQPHEQGGFIFANREVELFQAKQEANRTAQALRNRTYAHAAQPSLKPNFNGVDQPESALFKEPVNLVQLAWRRLTGQLNRFTHRYKLRRTSRPRSHRSTSNHMRGFSIQDVVIWVVGAAIARVGLDLLLQTFPGLWILTVIAIVAGVAIALYLTITTPTARSGLGLKLLMMMVGLLVGGRL
ncbi:MAG: hypothetical protein F6K19_00675 [Cyanothece sp. SIO1E1]|nr:hypothetical protein [Cyanothece sp. SIO1E1]